MIGAVHRSAAAYPASLTAQQQSEIMRLLIEGLLTAGQIAYRTGATVIQVSNLRAKHMGRGSSARRSDAWARAFAQSCAAPHG